MLFLQNQDALDAAPSILSQQAQRVKFNIVNASGVFADIVMPSTARKFKMEDNEQAWEDSGSEQESVIQNALHLFENIQKEIIQLKKSAAADREEYLKYLCNGQIAHANKCIKNISRFTEQIEMLTRLINEQIELLTRSIN